MSSFRRTARQNEERAVTNPPVTDTNLGKIEKTIISGKRFVIVGTLSPLKGVTPQNAVYVCFCDFADIFSGLHVRRNVPLDHGAGNSSVRNSHSDLMFPICM